MKINLIPVSHQELEIIEIDSDEFMIGRMEAPFVSAPTEITASLSRKHARIILEQDRYSIVDLGSTNGTKVNGKTVSDRFVPLNQDDLLELGGNITFKAEIIDLNLDATVLVPKRDQELILEPVDKQFGLDILVISGFPFLISKETGIFASFLSDFAQPMQQISRRHAYISVEQGQYLLTDMDSTNGTTINGIRITEPNTPLQQGDIISFGGDYFSYFVKFEQSSGPANNDTNATTLQPSSTPEITNSEYQEDKTEADISAESEIKPDRCDEPRTTFVNDPSPFLDILCAERDMDSEEDSFATDKNASLGQAEDNATKSGFFSNKLAFLKQLSGVFKTQGPAKNKWIIYAVITFLVLSFGAVFYQYLHNTNEHLQELIKKKKYQKAADLSIDLVQDAPEDIQLRNLSTQAILNAVIPQWKENVANEEFQNNQQLIQTAIIEYGKNPYAKKALVLLNWNNDVYQFMATRSETSKVIIFQNEQLLKKLVDTWHDNKKDNELTLARIARDVPSFSGNYNETLSFIRTLEHDQDIYLHAIEKLISKLKVQLNNDETDEMLTTVTVFEKKYRAISGQDDIKLDIHRYATMEQALKSKDIDLINKTSQDMVFLTPLFQQYAQQSLAIKLPSDNFTEQYQVAIENWKNGAIEPAINGLFSLSEDPWGSAAISKLKRYQAVLDQYNDLNRSRATSKYLDKLFAFHAQLKSPEDQFFLQSIENDFLENKKQAIATIQKRVDQALSDWQKYSDKGGIGGLMRLENSVSTAYRKQASLLANSFQNINYAKRLYSELKILDNSLWTQAYTAISEEMDKQKKWLQDLELILKPSVLKQKLDLLNSSERKKS